MCVCFARKGAESRSLLGRSEVITLCRRRRAERLTSRDSFVSKAPRGTKSGATQPRALNKILHGLCHSLHATGNAPAHLAYNILSTDAIQALHLHETWQFE